MIAMPSGSVQVVNSGFAEDLVKVWVSAETWDVTTTKLLLYL